MRSFLFLGEAKVEMKSLEEHIQNEATLLLPIATILETGNHIAHINDGRQRRVTAEQYVQLVQQALGNIEGPAPWTVPQPLLAPEDLQRYLNEFPDHAIEIGLGDLSIINEYERQCLHQLRRVFIWSLDIICQHTSSQLVNINVKQRPCTEREIVILLNSPVL